MANKPKLVDDPNAAVDPTELGHPVTDDSEQASEPSSDPFDLANLRLDPSKMENTGVKKLLTTVPVRKPKPQTFFRVHPDEKYRINVALLGLEEDGDIYLVPPPVLAALPEHIAALVKEHTLYTCMTRQGTVFLWHVKAVPAKGRAAWATSAREGASHAMKEWARIAWNHDLGAYEIVPAEEALKIPEPVWSNIPPFQELLRIGFRNRIITTVNHPVIDALRGK